MQRHVVFLQDAPMDAFHSGSKTIEFRVSRRRLPRLRARPGDGVFLKRVGGEVELTDTIITVDFCDGDLTAFIERWRHQAIDAGAYLLSKPGARDPGGQRA
jgi:hypothetical protein